MKGPTKERGAMAKKCVSERTKKWDGRARLVFFGVEVG
jgi:hypothetical protein